MNIKVCGMRDKQNIAELCRLPISYIGFIFYAKSPRFVGEDFDTLITQSIPPHIKKVGVFVNATTEYIESKVEKYSLDCVQLHGNESPEFCKTFFNNGITTIKAFGVDTSFDFSTVTNYQTACNYVLFDTKAPSHGGTGQKFDWNILKNYNGSLPFFLSGGIYLDDTESIQSMVDVPIHCVDINSKFEKNPAMKDIETIKQFISRLL